MHYVPKFAKGPRLSLEERQALLIQIYAQVLERQPYAYERKQLSKIEQDFLGDKIGVKRFLKELGHSEVYLNSFYHSSSNLKFLDWCFKHFMGRAPIDRTEVHTYCDVLMREGPKALITALLDSEEYRKLFGGFAVPHAQEHAHYPSPKAYLESDLLNHEHFGQRGLVMSTMNLHDLGLMKFYRYQHPEMADATSDDGDTAKLQKAFAQLLDTLNATAAEEIAAVLSPQQRARLIQALH